MVHHTVALCTVLCQSPNHSSDSHRYASVRRHFPHNVRTSSEQLNATEFARHCCLGTRGPMTLLAVTARRSWWQGRLCSWWHQKPSVCADRKVCNAEDVDQNSAASCTSTNVEVFCFCWLVPASARVKFAVSGKGLGGPQSGRCARTRKATVRADCRRKTGRQRQSQVPHTAVRPERRDATRWLAQPETPHRSDFSKYVWRTQICTPCYQVRDGITQQACHLYKN